MASEAIIYGFNENPMFRLNLPSKNEKKTMLKKTDVLLINIF